MDPTVADEACTFGMANLFRQVGISVRALPESVRAFVPAGRSFHTLGTDGFGRSNTRAALRQHFQVDAASIARLAQQALR